MTRLSSTTGQYLIWGMILIPLLGAVFAQYCKNFARLKLLSCLSFFPFFCALTLYPTVFIHKSPIPAGLDIFISGINFYLDGLSLFFCLFTSLIWSLASIYGYAYLHTDKGMQRYTGAWLLALSANLGLVIAEDLLTFFLFWELLSLSAYLLISHEQDEAALYAGKKYLALSLPGGICLLGGILILHTGTNSLQWSALWQNAGLSIQNWRIALTLILLGLMVKCGLMPLHIWLPDAHPAAPTPASALLSGVMIKAGAYGMIRLAQGYLQSYAVSPWTVQGHQLGYILLWVGLINMLLGVGLALFQSNAKRLLAYHSISQMGYIVLGIGMCLYWGEATALSGSLYHVVNHALFKSSLFLIVGVIYWQTGKLNLKELGGWFKLLPLLFVLALIASLGISGIPLFNGYVSKTLLHTCLSDGLKNFPVHFSWEPQIMEGIFILTGAGTLASFIKFMWFIFIQPAYEKQPTKTSIPQAMLIPIAVLSVLIILGGIFPYRMLGITGDALGIKIKLEPLFHELSGTVINAILGVTVFSLAYFSGFFRQHFTPIPLVDYAYRRLGQGGLFLFRQISLILTVLNNAGQNLLAETAAAHKKFSESRATLSMTAQGHWNCWQNRWSRAEEEVICYCKRWEQEFAGKYYESLHKRTIQKDKIQKIFIADLLRLSCLPERLLNLICRQSKRFENQLIKQAQKCKPTDGEESFGPFTALGYILVYFQRDLSLGLSLILLVLLMFLLPLIV
ncbi:MAG: hypothetical protein HZA78_06115 [Candidatus Schekmanbacteria bacterium]|nr:hypothetical protein [Candidatus Schekmanbacteria bacterium]